MRVWILAARPKTLPAGIAPVAVGTALASTAVAIDWLAAGACLLGALLIQIGCNYANDALDAATGADAQRVGPQRAVAAGLVSPRAMLLAAALVLALAFALGLYLASLGGWPILVLGLVSIACAILYTGGPFPLAYRGLGDLFVFLFFGLFATMGSAWIQVAPTLAVDPAAALPIWWWLSAAALGLQAAGILTVNNLRDLDTDAAVGKRTLPVRLGARAARVYHALLHAAAVGCLIAAAVLVDVLLLWGPVLIAGLGGVAVAVAVARARGPALNRQLARSAGLELVTGLSIVLACTLG